MERSRRVTDLWNYLPAFRAVAEVEHLPTAGELQHVSPSALSRTIKLLEEDLGVPLFTRVGRRIELNAAGQALLAAVRLAMRTVDEGIRAAAEGGELEPVRLSCPGPLVPSFVLPSVPTLEEELGVRLCITPMASGRVADALHRGELDLALLDDAVYDPQLTLRPVLRLPHDVFVRPGHPLASQGRLRAADLDAVRFVAPPADEAGHTPDAWPDARRRHIGLRVSQMQIGLDAVLRSDDAIVVPRVVGEAFGLRRLRVWFALPSTELVLAHRSALPRGGPPSAAERVAEVLLRELTEG